VRFCGFSRLSVAATSKLKVYVSTDLAFPGEQLGGEVVFQGDLRKRIFQELASIEAGAFGRRLEEPLMSAT
jgi:hypothetical protein